MWRQLSIWSVCGLLVLLMTGCDDTTYVSSVPSATVYIDINTLSDWQYVHFRPENMECTYIDREGYHYLTYSHALKENEQYRIGYKGVLIVADGTKFTAYDLCCPYCITRNKAVAVEPSGVFATCPQCGEQYDCSCGVGNPITGIGRESLKRYQLTYTSGIIRVRN